MKRKAKETKYRLADGTPKGDGPRCRTCGDLVAWGAHPGCERTRTGRIREQ
jgi:hypothetical protein